MRCTPDPRPWKFTEVLRSSSQLRFASTLQTQRDCAQSRGFHGWQVCSICFLVWFPRNCVVSSDLWPGLRECPSSAPIKCPAALQAPFCVNDGALVSRSLGGAPGSDALRRGPMRVDIAFRVASQRWGDVGLLRRASSVWLQWLEMCIMRPTRSIQV